MSTPHIPEGWPCITPRIVVPNPEGLVEFIKAVFGATGDFQIERPTELTIGDSRLMISPPTERETMTAFLYIYVEDTDMTFERALDLGAHSVEEPCEMPYGDRRAMLKDDWGNTWQIATHRGEFTP